MKIITKEEAIELGQKWFFTGAPCNHGHIDKRSISRGACYECSRIQKKKYSEKNIEKIRYQKRQSYKRNFEKISLKAKENYPKVKEERKKYLSEYYKKNREKILQKASEYFNENKEKVYKYKKKWVKTEIGILNAKKGKANRRKREDTYINRKELQEVIKKQPKCYWCNCKIDYKNSKSFHFDHYVPLAKGGSNTVDNLVVSCPKCNMSKKAKDPYEFAKSIGRLL